MPPNKVKKKGEEEVDGFHDCVVYGPGEDRSLLYGTTERNKKQRAPRHRGMIELDATTRRRRRQRRSSRSWSRSFSDEFSRRRSSFLESLPDTPQGWAVLISVLASACLGHELNLQKTLTCPPTVYGQIAASPVLQSVYRKLTATPDSILSRNIQPSLFVGTNGVLASAAAYSMPHHASSNGYLKFPEILKTSQDGATIGLDWELPAGYSGTALERQEATLHGPLDLHVVMILHGINNDSSFGYIQACMRACTRRGWAAVGMNCRGCGGVALTTPRPYTGAYTGDIRSVVRSIGSRLTEGKKLFLVGNSLGANMITKYLGEEGMSGTLPKFVGGGVSLGNPLLIDADTIEFPWNTLLSLGAQKGVLQHWKTVSQQNSASYHAALKGAMTAATIGQFDKAMAPIYIRNNPYAPFETQVGYPGGSREYFHDASSYRYVRFVSVPLLVLSSQDDFLVHGGATSKLAYCLSSPNVMVVQTKCGGHLGWQETPPDTGSMFGFGTSWADTATTDFIEAVLEGNTGIARKAHDETVARLKTRAKEESSMLKSRL